MIDKEKVNNLLFYLRKSFPIKSNIQWSLFNYFLIDIQIDCISKSLQKLIREICD